MRNYMPRIADTLLQEHLDAKGAVLIEGPKWCGKTTTAKQLAKSVIEMDHAEKSQQYKEMAQINPSLLLQGDVPHLIDEWQLAKTLWNAVRYEVDQRDEFGQFILTGSAVPAKYDETMHTGTGRISRLKMRPMSLFESKESTGEVSLAALFHGDKAEAICQDTLDKIAFCICRGGWPKAVGKTERVALKQAYDYYDAVVSDDVSRVDEVKKDPERTKRLMHSYARHIGTQASLEVIREDVKFSETDTFSQNTLYSYLGALNRIHLIEDVPAWNPNLRSKTAIRSSVTRYFTDPSIGAAALGVGPKDLINDLNTMGFYFENLCIRDLRVYADLLDGSVYHYRDKNGLECDAVIHLRNGTYGLIEVKLGGDNLIAEGVRNLLELTGKIDPLKMKKPAFAMVLTGVSPFAYQRGDGVYVVPIGCLGP